MITIKSKTLSSRHQAVLIAVVYLLACGIWISVTNFLLFGRFWNFDVQTLGRIEAISDAGIVLATAASLFLWVKRSMSALYQSKQMLQAQAERLQTLSHKLLEIQESERRAIAQELHDEVGQALTGLKLSLEMADRLSQEPVRESVKRALGLANDLMSRVRRMSLDLRPPALDDLGLVAVLPWYFERYTRQTEVQVDFRHQGLEGRVFGRGVETAAYRIIQEALTNVARHACAKLAEVRIWTDDVSLNLHVDDHGNGFDAQLLDPMNSSGLVGMQERASLLGGVLTLDTHPNLGTRVAATLPIAGYSRTAGEGGASADITDT